MELPKGMYARKDENRLAAWAKTPSGKRYKLAYGSTVEACLKDKEKKEQECRDALQAEKSTLPSFPPGSLAEFTYGTYFPRIIGKGARTTTQHKYQGQFRHHILPALMPDGRTLGMWQLAEINYEALEHLKQGLVKRNKKGGPTEERLSDTETREIVTRLKELLNLAKKMGRIKHEDWRLVSVPKKPKKKKRAKPPADFTTVLLRYVEKERPWMVGPLFAALFLGLRRGEICGLKWARIDRSEMTVTVSEQDHPLLGQGAETKSEERVLHVDQTVIDWLDKLGNKNSPWVFNSPKGGPVSPSTLTNKVPEVVIAAGLPRTTIHDMRSYAASNLARLGWDLVTIMSILGHTEIDTTMIYLDHNAPSQRKAFKSLVEDLLVDKDVDGSARSSA